MQAAQSLQSPFVPGLAVDWDIEFAALVTAVFGPYARHFREEQWDAYYRVVRAFDPVWQHHQRSAGPTVKLVALEKNPLAMAVNTVFLRWPDRTVAPCFVEGFRTVGLFQRTGVFRDILPSSFEEDPVEAFLAGSHEAMAQLLSSRPLPAAPTIYKLTLEERDKGFCEGPFAAGDLHRKFGVGRWRFVPRFLVTQSDGKLRLIDNAKGLANVATVMEETIYTVGIDFVPSTVSCFVHAILQAQGLDPLSMSVQEAVASLPEWAGFRMGIDDLPDAYRGCPVHHQSSASLWWLSLMRSLPSGSSSCMQASFLASRVLWSPLIGTQCSRLQRLGASWARLRGRTLTTWPWSMSPPWLCTLSSTVTRCLMPRDLGPQNPNICLQPQLGST